jgi:lysophospholipase L1-like esterase
LRKALGKLLLLFVAGTAAALVGEVTVRAIRPGFPGFRIPQVEHRPVAGLGFEMVPNQHAYTAAEPATINAHGFRGPELRNLRSDSGLRVLCIGDSITFGYGVGDDVPFPRQLEHLSQQAWPERDVEVINAGVQRYFTYQEIDFLRGRGLELRPDIVVLVVYSNDLGVRPSGDYLREYEKEREQAASAFRNRLPLLYTLVKNSALVELSKGAYLRATTGGAGLRMFEGVATARDEERWNSMRQELAAFKQLARDHDVFPMVVAVPARIQIQKDFPSSLYPKRVLMLAQSEGLNSVDLVATFRQSLEGGVDPYLPWDNHLSAAGHSLVAKSIINRLIELRAPLETRITLATRSRDPIKSN